MGKGNRFSSLIRFPVVFIQYLLPSWAKEMYIPSLGVFFTATSRPPIMAPFVSIAHHLNRVMNSSPSEYWRAYYNGLLACWPRAAVRPVGRAVSPMALPILWYPLLHACKFVHGPHASMRPSSRGTGFISASMPKQSGYRFCYKPFCHLGAKPIFVLTCIPSADSLQSSGGNDSELPRRMHAVQLSSSG